jgi:hypothetical protein
LRRYIKFLVHDDALPAFYTLASRFVRIIDPCPRGASGESQYMCPNYECYSSEAWVSTRPLLSSACAVSVSVTELKL